MNFHATWNYNDVTTLRQPSWIPHTVVDVGAGLRNGNISKQIATIPCQTLYTVEPFDKYIPILFAVEVKAKRQFLRCEPIETFEFPADEKMAVYMLDVIEHLAKDDALALIERVRAKADYLAIFLPLDDTVGYMSDFENLGNQKYQTHKSVWTAEELESLGFAVDVFNNFHPHVRAVPTHAAWAIWQR